MLPLAIFNSLCDFNMLNETVYKRFEKTTKNHKNLPFVHITVETANVFGIESEEISYGQMLPRLVRLASPRSRSDGFFGPDLRPSARVPSPWTMTRSFVS